MSLHSANTYRACRWGGNKSDSLAPERPPGSGQKSRVGPVRVPGPAAGGADETGERSAELAIGRLGRPRAGTGPGARVTVGRQETRPRPEPGPNDLDARNRLESMGNKRGER